MPPTKLTKKTADELKYTIYKNSANQRGYVFDISYPTFYKLINSRCYYCGTLRKRNGVDRYDNTKGYIRGNCVPCCTRCNRAKMTMHGDEFIALCKQITEHRKNPKRYDLGFNE